MTVTFFNFELKRFVNNPKNRICLALVFLLILGLFVVNQTLFHQKLSAGDMNLVKLNLQQSQQAVSTLEQQVQLHPSDERLSQLLSNAKVNYELFSKQLSALKKGDLATYAKLQYQVDMSQMKQISKADKKTDEYKDLKSRIAYYKAVKAVKGSPSSSINSTTESAFTTGFLMTAWLSSTSLFVLFTVLLTDSISHEIESSQIRFYQFQGSD